jgi:hypothetical protein
LAGPQASHERTGEAPRGSNTGQASEQELPEASGLFDLFEYQLDGLFS